MNIKLTRVIILGFSLIGYLGTASAMVTCMGVEAPCVYNKGVKGQEGTCTGYLRSCSKTNPVDCQEFRCILVGKKACGWDSGKSCTKL